MSHKPHKVIPYQTLYIACNCCVQLTTITLKLVQAHIPSNLLDLYLFPSMSHRHSAHLQRGTNMEPSLARIWEVVDSVWHDTVSAEVARSCL
jgi:hypothetical protein